MNTIKGILALISVILVIKPSVAECPNQELLSPCVCNETTKSISCRNTPNDFDLLKLFAKISPNIKNKTFSVFTLENSQITKLVVKVLGDIHFKRYEFINCTELRWVSQDAFGGQTPYINELVFENTPVTNDPISDLNLFDAINRLPSIELLDLSGTQLTGIPDEAIIPILNWYDFRIKDFLFCKPTEKCRSIKSVGKKAFYYLNKLSLVDLSRHRISFVDDFAFSLHNITNIGHKLLIVLDDNQLSADSFTDTSFQFIGKPTLLSLNDNKNLTLLRQEVFEPFLTDNIHNQLNVTGCPINWNSTQMTWFKNLSDQIKKRVHF